MKTKQLRILSFVMAAFLITWIPSFVYAAPFYNDPPGTEHEYPHPDPNEFDEEEAEYFGEGSDNSSSYYDSYDNSGSFDTNNNYSSGWGPNGYQADYEGGGTYSLYGGGVDTGYESDLFDTSASANYLLGLQAQGTGHLGLNQHGVHLGLTGNALAGAQSSVTVGWTQNILGLFDVTLEMTGSLVTGFGATLTLDAQLGGDGVGVIVGGGLSQGTGANYEMKLKVEPSGMLWDAIVNGVTGAASWSADKLGDLWNWAVGNRAAQVAIMTPDGGFDWSGQGWNRSWVPSSSGTPWYPPAGGHSSGPRPQAGGNPPTNNPEPPANPLPPPRAPDVSGIKTGDVPDGQIFGGTPKTGPAWYDGKETHLGIPPWMKKDSEGDAPENTPTPEPESDEGMPIVDPVSLPPSEGGDWSFIPEPDLSAFGGVNEPVIDIDLESILPPESVALDGYGNVWYIIDGKSLNFYEYEMKALEKGRQDAAVRAAGKVAIAQVEIEVLEKNLNEARQELDRMQKENNEKGAERAKDEVKHYEGKLKDAKQRKEKEMSEIRAFDAALDKAAQMRGWESYEDYLGIENKSAGADIQEKMNREVIKAPAPSSLDLQTALGSIRLPLDGALSENVKDAFAFQDQQLSPKRLEFDGVLGSWSNARRSEGMGSLFLPQSVSGGASSSSSGGGSECPT